MNSEKGIALFLIIIGSYMIYLESQNRLVPAIQALINGGNGGTLTTSSVGKYSIALVVYLVIISQLSPSESLDLTAILVLGAIYIDSKQSTTPLLKNLGLIK